MSAPKNRDTPNRWMIRFEEISCPQDLPKTMSFSAFDCFLGEETNQEMVYEEVGLANPTMLETARGVWHFLPAGDDALLFLFGREKKEAIVEYHLQETLLLYFLNIHMSVCKNRGTPKWMVYNEKPY